MKLTLGRFFFTNIINVPFKHEYYPQLPPIPSEISIDYIQGDNLWGKFIEYKGDRSERYFSGIVDSNGIINIVINNVSNMNIIIKPLSNSKYEIITRLDIGLISKCIGQFKPLSEYIIDKSIKN